MKIEFDNDQMKALVSEAILKSFDEEKRNALVQGAIKHLLTPEENGRGYNSRTSPIEDAFKHAVRGVAERIAGEMLANDESVKAKIQELLNEALTRLMVTNREITVARLADSIAEGMAYRADR